jgi:hypothetical protein
MAEQTPSNPAGVVAEQPPAAPVLPDAAPPSPAPVDSGAAPNAVNPASPAVPGDPPQTVEPAAPVPPVAPKDLKLGKDSLLEQTHVDEIAATASAQGLSTEQAQELLTQAETRTNELRNANIAKWTAEIKADPHLGGDKWETTQANAKLFRDHFAKTHPAAVQLLDRTGYANHPAIAALINDIGKSMAPDKGRTPQASSPAPAEKPLAQRFYPSMSKETSDT